MMEESFVSSLQSILEARHNCSCGDLDQLQATPLAAPTTRRTHSYP
jgi:hypothetical protein